MIKRHDLIQRWNSSDSVKEELKKRVKRLNNYLQVIKERPGKSNQFINGQILNLICILLLLDEGNKDLLYTGLIYYVDTGISHFEQFFSQEELITCQIGNGKFQFETIDSDLWINSNQWVNLLSASLILKDKKRLNSVLKYKSNISKLEEDTFKKPFIEYMEHIGTSKMDEKRRTSCIKLMEDSSESNMGIHILLSGGKKGIVPKRSKYLKAILLPIVHLYELAISKKEDSFNDYLTVFLKNRAKHFTKENGVIADFIDLKASACCSFALEKGLKITTKGDYVPQKLWSKNWENAKIIY